VNRQRAVIFHLHQYRVYYRTLVDHYFAGTPSGIAEQMAAGHLRLALNEIAHLRGQTKFYHILRNRLMFHLKKPDRT
jgi:hypothetical protein